MTISRVVRKNMEKILISKSVGSIGTVAGYMLPKCL